MAITGLLFPDVNEHHPVTDFDKASAAGIVGYRIRDDSPDGSYHMDDKALYHYNGFAGRGLVELVYTVEDVGVNGAQAYQRLKTAFPWRPGIIYCADIEKGGLVGWQAKQFVQAAHLDNKPAGIYGLAASMFDAPAADVKWVARYSLPQPAGAHVWQFNGGAPGLLPDTFPGVYGNCDMNKLIISLDKIRQMAGLEGTDMTDEQKAQLAEALQKARYGDERWEGAKMRLQGLPRPTQADWTGPPQRLGWDMVDKALSEPAAGEPAPHSHTGTVLVK